VPEFAGLPGSMTSGYTDLAYDFYENIPALSFPLSTLTYARMRRDPQIAAVLKAYVYPLRMATYAINPTGCRDEVVEMCADAWGLPIAGMDDNPGPARRRGVRWRDHLRVALLMLPFGFSPFAIRYDITGNPLQARLAELSERGRRLERSQHDRRGVRSLAAQARDVARHGPVEPPVRHGRSDGDRPAR
jgi:hypothetical protein